MSKTPDQIALQIESFASSQSKQPQFIAMCELIYTQQETNDILKSLLINIKQIKEGLIKNEK